MDESLERLNESLDELARQEAPLQEEQHAEGEARLKEVMLKQQQEAMGSEASYLSSPAHQTLQAVSHDSKKQQQQQQRPQPIATAAKPVQPADAHSSFQRALEKQQSRELAGAPTTIRGGLMATAKKSSTGARWRLEKLTELHQATRSTTSCHSSAPPV